MSKASIISSDIENRLKSIQQRLVGTKIESRTRADLFNDISVSLNIGFVLLEEIKRLTSASLLKTEFVDIDKKIEAKPKIKPASNIIEIDSIYVDRIYDKAVAMSKGEAKYDDINNLRAYIGFAKLLDNINYTEDKYINEILSSFNTDHNPKLIIDKQNIICRFSHRKDQLVHYFSSEFLDNLSSDSIIVFITGECGKDCKFDSPEFACRNFQIGLDVCPRGWITSSYLSKKRVRRSSITVPVHEFEKNSFEDLLNLNDN